MVAPEVDELFRLFFVIVIVIVMENDDNGHVVGI
jgi:hypothetical protein